MFDIEYKGGNSVVLTTKKGRLVVDPKASLVGLKDLSVKDAVELATEERFSIASEEARLVIDGPGEFEVGDFSIRGIAAERHIDGDTGKNDGTMYRIEVGDIKIAVIGNISPKLSEEQYEDIGLVDIILIPVGGGGYTLDATHAATIIRQVEPKMVIPIHYADYGLKYEVPQEALDVFVKELAAPVEEADKDKLKIKTASSLPQVMTVVPLGRS